MFILILEGMAQSSKITAENISRKVVHLFQLGRYNDALPLAKKALEIKKSYFGSESAEVAVELNNLAMVYSSLGDYVMAEPLFERALEICQKIFGPEDTIVAQNLCNLGDHYRERAEYSKAESLLKRALEIYNNVPRAKDLGKAWTLNNLGLLYRDLGDYSKAVTLLHMSLDFLENTIETENPHIAKILNSLAEIYCVLGEYSKAESFFNRALFIWEKKLGQIHPDVARGKNNLGELYSILGNFSKAESFLINALATWKKTIGPDHPDVARCLNNLAGIYMSFGEYYEAESHYLLALSILEKTLGPVHPDVARGLNNLAALYRNLGEYSKAEVLFQKAFSILEESLGSEHPDVARNMSSLAEFNLALGNYRKAEVLFQKVIFILEKALGRYHPDVARGFNNIAGTYRVLGENKKAKLYFERALAIKEKTLGPEHPDVAKARTNLAEIYHRLCNYLKAEILYYEGLSVLEKALGEEHSDVAVVLNNLAVFYYDKEDFPKAKIYFDRALSLFNKNKYYLPQEFTVCLYNKAALYAALGDFQKAHILHKQCIQIDKDVIDNVLGFTSEERKKAFLATKNAEVHASISLVVKHLILNQSARKDAFDFWLNRKGIIFDAQRMFQEALIDTDNPEALNAFKALCRKQNELHSHIFNPLSERSAEFIKNEIVKLESEISTLKDKLAQLCPVYAQNKNIYPVDTNDVIDKLPNNSALIEFACIRLYNFQEKKTKGNWLTPHYIAFVVQHQQKDNVLLINLGDALEIDQLIKTLKCRIMKMHVIDSKITEISNKIYKKVFAPILDNIEKVRNLFIAPDGNLNLMPFEILIGSNGRYLIEDFCFNYINSGRELILFNQHYNNDFENRYQALLIGNPDFDLKESGDNKNNFDYIINWPKLPHTEHEVREIQLIIHPKKADFFVGRDATEEVLSTWGTPSILHIATHGFFFNRKARRISSSLISNSRAIIVPEKLDSVTLYLDIENPFHRSGFVLAGANSGYGIITAEKVLRLKLRGTDMVVLSACDTGIGEVQTGEGVYGLRRAFTQTGAKALVMSLWQVPDEGTKELMLNFYRNLKENYSRCESLRQSILTRLKTYRDMFGYQYPNPYYWGGFIFIGNPSIKKQKNI